MIQSWNKWTKHGDDHRIVIGLTVLALVPTAIGPELRCGMMSHLLPKKGTIKARRAEALKQYKHVLETALREVNELLGE